MRKTASIILAALLAGMFAAQFTACEKYVLPELSISTDTLYFSAGPDSLQFFVHTNTITTAEAENAYWIQTDPAWMDADTTVTVYVGHYVGSTSRTGTIVVKSESLQRNLFVIQVADPDDEP